MPGHLCQELGIDDLNPSKMETSFLKRAVEGACHEINESELKAII